MKMCSSQYFLIQALAERFFSIEVNSSFPSRNNNHCYFLSFSYFCSYSKKISVSREYEISIVHGAISMEMKLELPTLWYAGKCSIPKIATITNTNTTIDIFHPFDSFRCVRCWKWNCVCNRKFEFKWRFCLWRHTKSEPTVST